MGRLGSARCDFHADAVVGSSGRDFSRVLSASLKESVTRTGLSPLDIDGAGGEGSHDSAGVHHNT